jgi:ornithine--oxo-acid transaminase
VERSGALAIGVLCGDRRRAHTLVPRSSPLSSLSVPQGHCHPRLVRTMQEQCSRLTLTSRAFFNDQLALFEEAVVDAVGHAIKDDNKSGTRVLPMNTGVEAAETAMKLARRWAYDVKGVPKDQAVVLFASGNFWGRSIAAISSSDDPASFGGFGPLLPGIARLPYGDLRALEDAFAANADNIAAFMVEPIQGEAGMVVPHEGYLKGVRELCDRYNVLMIADEIQTGLCRTGRMLAVDHEHVRVDVLVLGKALSGGMLPVSAAVARSEIMLTIKPGQHGSTYGGNPLASAVAREALAILRDEKLADNAQERGVQVRAALSLMVEKYPHLLQGTRGKGLLNALIVRPDARSKHGAGVSATDICLRLKEQGMLAKPTRGHIIRLAPPLTITAQQVDECMRILDNVLDSLQQ